LFSLSVNQFVLIHSNFLISDRGHASFLMDVLLQQGVELFIPQAPRLANGLQKYAAV